MQSLCRLVLFVRVYVCCARDFSHWCGQALELNGRLIQEDQLPLQQSMEKDYREMCSKLEAMIGPLSEAS